MRSVSLFTAVVLCLPVFATAQTNENIVPAGTVLQCTLDEPRFSSQTAQVGDPVLCQFDSLGLLGRPAFPRGAYLSGRFEDFRDPGHLFGKGWLKLEFESLTVPGGTFPVSARIVSVPHYRVDAVGRIRGRGHARRDAMEWSLPILWPEKLITLPARGPRPTLKGETRIQLRILEDVSIATEATVASRAALSVPLSSTKGSSVIRGTDSEPSTSVDSGLSSRATNGIFPKLRYGGVSIPAAEGERPLMRLPVEGTVVSDVNQPMERPWRAVRLTFLICKDGRTYVATNYWFVAGQFIYVASDGSRQALPPGELDFEMTARFNRERGVPFVIRARPSEP